MIVYIYISLWLKSVDVEVPKKIWQKPCAALHDWMDPSLKKPWGGGKGLSMKWETTDFFTTL